MKDKTIDILRRTESNRTLFGFTVEDLEGALILATREIHKHQIERELRVLKKKRKPAWTDGMTRIKRGLPRVPTKRELQ